MSRDGRVRSEEVALKFGRNLFRCRRRAAMSQEELGVRAQLHRTEIGMLEHGTRLARVDTLMKLAGALEISPEELLEGIHWTPAPADEGRFSISNGALGERTLPRPRGEEC
jgi:transcriptional regulator with XRE-family HTH domain